MLSVQFDSKKTLFVPKASFFLFQLCEMLFFSEIGFARDLFGLKLSEIMNVVFNYKSTI